MKTSKQNVDNCLFAEGNDKNKNNKNKFTSSSVVLRYFSNKVSGLTNFIKNIILHIFKYCFLYLNQSQKAWINFCTFS